MILNKINNLLEKTFNIRLIKSKPMPKVKNNSDFLIIEFIGASGVGKTTLCNYFIKNYRKDMYDISLFDNYLYNENSFFKENSIYNELLSKHITLIGTLNKNGEEMLQSILFSKKILIREITINQYLKKGVYFLEEGLYHIFGTHIQNYTDKDIIEKLSKNRALIFCEANPEFIYNNIKKRNRQTGIHSDLTDKQILNNINFTLKNKKIQLERFKKLGIPILELNTENEMDNNCNLINQFIKGLNQ